MYGPGQKSRNSLSAFDLNSILMNFIKMRNTCECAMFNSNFRANRKPSRQANLVRFEIARPGSY